MKKIINKIKEIKNALKVLEIMDKVGCDIEEAPNISNNEEYWKIKPKWYITKKDAETLRKIILYKRNYFDNEHRKMI